MPSALQVIFFEHVLLYNLKGEAGGPEDVACLEQAEVVREGTDCVVFTYSRMRWTVMQAVSQLEKEVRLFPTPPSERPVHLDPRVVLLNAACTACLLPPVSSVSSPL